MAIREGDTIIFHFSLYLEDGSAADSSKVDNKPVKSIFGNGDFSDAFYREIEACQPGDSVEFELEADDAFGQPNPDSIHYMDRSKFDPELTLDPGVIIAFQNMAGQQTPGIIRCIEGDSVKVDFNHPLAGHKVRFKIEMLEIHAAERT